MKKIFVMFLAALMFIVPATAESGDGTRLTMDTPIVFSYDNFANTKLFASDDTGAWCFLIYLMYLDWKNYDYYDESINGFRMSMVDLGLLAKYIFEQVANNDIPSDVMEIESTDTSCPVLHDMLKNHSGSIEDLSVDFVFDAVTDVMDMQEGQVLTELKKAEENAERSRRIEANMNGNPDDIYNITVQYTDIDASYARRQMFAYIQSYIINRYCATESAVMSCAPTPSLDCDLLPNTTYLQRDLDLLCNNRNWSDYVIGDGVYELRLERQ